MRSHNADETCGDESPSFRWANWVSWQAPDARSAGAGILRQLRTTSAGSSRAQSCGGTELADALDSTEWGKSAQPRRESRTDESANDGKSAWRAASKTKTARSSKGTSMVRLVLDIAW